jgi:hypothetical protein
MPPSDRIEPANIYDSPGETPKDTVGQSPRSNPQASHETPLSRLRPETTSQVVATDPNQGQQIISNASPRSQRDLRSPDIDTLEDILADTAHLRNGRNIPMAGSNHGSDTEGEGAHSGNDDLDDANGDVRYTGVDSDSSSVYSQPSGYDSPDADTSALSPPEQDNTIAPEGPDSSAHDTESSPIPTPTARTPPVDSAPTEHLANVLQHGLHSRNRRLRPGQRARGRSPPPVLPDQDAGPSTAYDSSGVGETGQVRNFYAAHEVQVYREIVIRWYFAVFGERMKPFGPYEPG